jgi:hypothetical protein
MSDQLQIGRIDHNEAVFRALKQSGKALRLGKHIPEALKLLVTLLEYQGMIVVRHCPFLAFLTAAWDCEMRPLEVGCQRGWAQLDRLTAILAVGRLIYQEIDRPH